MHNAVKATPTPLARSLSRASELVNTSWKFWSMEWPKWWNSRSFSEKYLAAGFFGLYWLVLGLHGVLNKDYFMVGGLILFLCHAGPFTYRILKFLLPGAITLIFYDSMRYWGDYVRGPIHVEQPYQFDKTFFGIQSAQGVLTP